MDDDNEEKTPVTFYRIVNINQSEFQVVEEKNNSEFTPMRLKFQVPSNTEIEIDKPEKIEGDKVPLVTFKPQGENQQALKIHMGDVILNGQQKFKVIGAKKPNNMKKREKDFIEASVKLTLEVKYPGIFSGKKKDQSGEYNCYICGKHFRYTGPLKRHINNHLIPRRICRHCGDYFEDEKDFSMHLKSHSEEKIWKCRICEKAFNLLGSLRRHMSIHNVEGKPYQCDECDKKFPDKNTYNKHKFVHAGIRPHECEVCRKSFFHIGDLNAHKKIHDTIKPYKCQYCGRTFTKQNNFMRHEGIHKGSLKCDLCGVGFNFQSTLTRHLLTHLLKERPKNSADEDSFIDNEGVVEGQEEECPPESRVCVGVDEEVCDKIQIKIKKSKYFCDLCKLGFNRKSKLTVHLLNHLKDKEKVEEEEEGSGKSFSEIGEQNTVEDLSVIKNNVGEESFSIMKNLVNQSVELINEDSNVIVLEASEEVFNQIKKEQEQMGNQIGATKIVLME